MSILPTPKKNCIKKSEIIFSDHISRKDIMKVSDSVKYEDKFLKNMKEYIDEEYEEDFKNTAEMILEKLLKLKLEPNENKFESWISNYSSKSMIYE
jgi:hypothetical protein